KGGGCENMSRMAMLSPGDGRRGIVDFVVETVRIGGGRPCPPVIVGVGTGANFESSALIAKRALLRTVGLRNSDPDYAELENELLEKINALGIGPMGLGGHSTALDVFVEAAPCHIASLPVAVNIQCHSARHGKIEL
ncbi:MAG: fumarate hydratase, partial [Candidatus Latescibacteria bacterium]|nr:fumarate hydratase [Candidatus Latescibacterota bacterium]